MIKIKLPKAKTPKLRAITTKGFQGKITVQFKKSIKWLNDHRHQIEWHPNKGIPANVLNQKMEHLTTHQNDFLGFWFFEWQQDWTKHREAATQSLLESRHILSAAKIESFLSEKFGLKNGKETFNFFFSRMMEDDPFNEPDFFLLPVDEKEWEKTINSKQTNQKGKKGALFFLMVAKEFGDFAADWDGERCLAVRNDLKVEKKKAKKK